MSDLYKGPFFIATFEIINEEEKEIDREEISISGKQEMETCIKDISTYNNRQQRLFDQGHITNPKIRKLIT